MTLEVTVNGLLLGIFFLVMDLLYMIPWIENSSWRLIKTIKEWQVFFIVSRHILFMSIFI
jgi:hypothetical protein